MWMPTDLASSGTGTTVGIVLGCAIAYTLGKRLVPIY